MSIMALRLNLHTLIKLSKCPVLPHSIDLFPYICVREPTQQRPNLHMPFQSTPYVFYNQFLSGCENNKPLINTFQFPSGHFLMLRGRRAEGFICSIALTCLSSLDVSPLFSLCGCVEKLKVLFLIHIKYASPCIETQRPELPQYVNIS